MKVYVLTALLEDTDGDYEPCIVGIFTTEKSALKIAASQESPYIEEWEVTK